MTKIELVFSLIIEIFCFVQCLKLFSYFYLTNRRNRKKNLVMITRLIAISCVVVPLTWYIVVHDFIPKFNITF